MEADSGDPSSPLGLVDPRPFSPMSTLAWEAHPSLPLLLLPVGQDRARSPGDAPKAGQRDLGHKERHGKGCRAHEKSRGGSCGAQKCRQKPMESPGERRLEGSGPAQSLAEFSGVLEDSGRAPGCKGRQKESLGVHLTCSEDSSSPKGTWRALGHAYGHAGMWKALGCKESQRPGLVALQKKHVEGSGAARKGNAGLGYAAKGRRKLPGHAESHLRTTQGLRPPQSPRGGLSSLGTPGAGLQPPGSWRSHKQRNPDGSRGKSSSLCPTSGHPTLWKRFPRHRLLQGRQRAEP